MTEVNMNKLYALNIIEKDGSDLRMVAASNERRKLELIAICHHWSLINDPNDKSLKQTSQEGEFPFYSIREIPYVC